MHHVIALCEFVPPPLLPPRRVPDAVQWWRWGATCYARHLHDPAELTVLWSDPTTKAASLAASALGQRSCGGGDLAHHRQLLGRPGQVVGLPPPHTGLLWSGQMVLRHPGADSRGVSTVEAPDVRARHHALTAPYHRRTTRRPLRGDPIDGLRSVTNYPPPWQRTCPRLFVRPPARGQAHPWLVVRMCI